jgi:type I restriction enzyme M protein
LGLKFHGWSLVYDNDERVVRDKASLDIFWLKSASLEDSDNLPAPGEIAAEIVEDLKLCTK